MDGRPANRWSGRFWLTTALVVALLAAMIVHLAGTAELASVRRLSIGLLGVACLLQLLSQLFLNASMLLPLRSSLRDLGFWELYLVRTGGFLVGSLVPVAGGVAVRLAYLRQRGVTYLDFTWATLVSNVLGLAAGGLVAAAAMAVFWAIHRRPPAAILGVAAALLVLSAAAIAVFESIPRATSYSGLRRWAWLAGMAGLRANPAMAAGVFFYSVGRHCLNFLTFGLLTQSLSHTPGDFLSGGLLYALTSPVRMVNITPANLGVTEWVVALVGEALAFDLTIGLIAALAFRGISLVAVAMGMVLASASVALARGRST
ncbi:MAG TPA: lysylphosphatidylglycerol synthase domain-containing protein [Vicinamibacterales bacterium]|nr:lysylphosphatidylglycerol synthase domain-containing protein [Vicinamibacterales bacterium]